VKQNGKWGYLNRQGKMVITPQFSTATKFKNGIAQTKIDGQYAWIDKTGKPIWREQ
jgi:hypothetical protein